MMFNNIRLEIFKFLLLIYPKKYNKSIGIGFYDRYRFKETNFAKTVRTFFLQRLGVQCGDNSYIAHGVYINSHEKLIIGNNVSIQHYCIITAYGGITIGNDVSIGNGTNIISLAHPHNNKNYNKHTPLIAKPVIIDDNCISGMNSSILMGVHIHERCIVGVK